MVDDRGRHGEPWRFSSSSVPHLSGSGSRRSDLRCRTPVVSTSSPSRSPRNAFCRRATITPEGSAIPACRRTSRPPRWRSASSGPLGTRRFAPSRRSVVCITRTTRNLPWWKRPGRLSPSFLSWRSSPRESPPTRSPPGHRPWSGRRLRCPCHPIISKCPGAI